jgi:hypothetical protein
VPLFEPPSQYAGTPSAFLLRRGTCLWRVHGQALAASGFRHEPADRHFGGARFDGTPEDPYPYYYAGLGESTAIAETLLRDLHPDERGTRVISRGAVTGRQISGLALTRDLTLVDLRTARDLAAIAQDHWLVDAPGSQYDKTRAWASWIRRQAPWAHGLIWDSLRDKGEPAVVLFGDRCAAAAGGAVSDPAFERRLLHEVGELAVDLDDGDGADYLNALLRPYRAEVCRPWRLARVLLPRA